MARERFILPVDVTGVNGCVWTEDCEVTARVIHTDAVLYGPDEYATTQPSVQVTEVRLLVQPRTRVLVTPAQRAELERRIAELVG